jgi:hypothetical protein
MFTRSLVMALPALALCAAPAIAADSGPMATRASFPFAPPSVTAAATLATMGASGKMTVVRQGTNGFTCVTGPAGADLAGPAGTKRAGTAGTKLLLTLPVCLDKQAQQWYGDYIAQKPRPTNTKPGFAYLDPPASTLVLVLWPFDSSSGVPTRPGTTGTWVMRAGTPYAHLMIGSRL